jgi:hypothetical protein
MLIHAKPLFMVIHIQRTHLNTIHQIYIALLNVMAKISNLELFTLLVCNVSKSRLFLENGSQL